MIRTNAAKFTNMIIARLREKEGRYMVRESKVFLKYKIKVASGVSSKQ